MINKLSKYEVKILNRVISKTTEGSQFSIYEILNDFNSGLSGFDRHYIQSVNEIPLTLSNFLIDKGLAEKVFEQNIRWTDKGKRLRKYRKYQLYKFISDPLSEIITIAGLIATILGIIWAIMQFSNSCNKSTNSSTIENKGK